MGTQKLTPEPTPARLLDLSILSHGAHSESDYATATNMPTPPVRCTCIGQKTSATNAWK